MNLERSRYLDFTALEGGSLPSVKVSCNDCSFTRSGSIAFQGSSIMENEITRACRAHHLGDERTKPFFDDDVRGIIHDKFSVLSEPGGVDLGMLTVGGFVHAVIQLFNEAKPFIQRNTKEIKSNKSS